MTAGQSSHAPRQKKPGPGSGSGAPICERPSKAAAVELVRAAGATMAEAVQYVDAWLEYTEATANIEKHGIIVLHPRTGAPFENPFLAIRDRALRKLQGMCQDSGEALW